jgi:hypothetical protein
LLLLFVGSFQSIIAQTLIETSVEARYQLDLQVPEAALIQFVPDGWTTDIRTEGNAKDANLRVIFIERIMINDAEGRPVRDGTSQMVYLTAPVKKPDGESTQLVIGGITNDMNDTPGPFGVYLPANSYDFKRSISSDSGLVIESQDWKFETSTGEFLEMQITFERTVGNRRPQSERLYCSANDPDYCQLIKQEQMLDVMRNVTTRPQDRVREFSFRAGGGSYAALFDGTEHLLSWDNILWLDQEIYLP